MSNGHNLEHIASEIGKLVCQEEEYGLSRADMDKLHHLRREYHYLDHKQRMEKYRVKMRREDGTKEP